MSATVEHQITTATFMARRSELILVYRHGTVTFDGYGNRIVVDGKRLEFIDGRLDINPEKLKKLKIEDSVETVVTWLRDHDQFGNTQEGFFEIEPPAPQPNDELAALAVAGPQLDLETVRRIYTEEQAGYNRPLVIQTCEAMIAQIGREVEATVPPAVEE
jgi:hypothetical protein